MRLVSFVGSLILCVSLLQADVDGDLKKAREFYDQKNYSEAINIWKPLAEQGNVEAQSWMGEVFYYGNGVSIDLSESEKWHLLAAKQGDKYSQKIMGIINSNNKNYATAVDWFKSSAQQNDAFSQYSLCTLYNAGLGVPQDYKEAIKWCTKAAEQGILNAKVQLGVNYHAGQGVEKDYTKAMDWYLQAAKENSAWAIRNIGLLYHNGYGVEQSYLKAREYYQKACDIDKNFGCSNKDALEKDPFAQYGMAYAYYKGENGAKQDYSKAFEWFEKAANQNVREAQNFLGVMYQDGHGVDKNQGKAVEWFRKAAGLGDQYGQKNLADMYYRGEGVSKDFYKAAELYQKSADQGHSWSQYMLGMMYMNGEGVLQDTKKALEYYEKAADQGEEYAWNNLGVHYRYTQMGIDSLPLAYAFYNISASKGSEKAIENRESISKEMTQKQIEIGQELSRKMLANGVIKTRNEYISGEIIKLAAKGKNTQQKSSVNAKLAKTVKPASPYPPKPAKRPGVTSCNTNCNNGDCYRTYDNGKKKHFQVSPTYNPLNSQWEYNPGPC